jgi:hypothetical protein
MSTFAGVQFMRSFNTFYYSFSPMMAQVVATTPILASSIRTLMYPLIAILQLASLVVSTMPFHLELMIVMTGIAASSLMGIAYLAPVAYLVIVRKNARNLAKGFSLGKASTRTATRKNQIAPVAGIIRE